jgi:hypothetical protein
MATDGGQIRTNSKIYAEQNHSKTCTTSDIMTSGKCIVANGAKAFTLHIANKKGILITDAKGNATFIAVPEGSAGYNKLLSTDAKGDLTWIDKQRR